MREKKKESDKFNINYHYVNFKTDIFQPASQKHIACYNPDTGNKFYLVI